MDRYDRDILDALQHDCSLSVSVLADKVGLGTTACWRRVHRLEVDGVITQRVALLNPHRVCAALVLLVSVRLHVAFGPGVDTFMTTVLAMPEITQAYRLQDSARYALQMQVVDLAAYDVLAQRLVACPVVASLETRTVMETLKQTTALPLTAIVLEK